LPPFWAKVRVLTVRDEQAKAVVNDSMIASRDGHASLKAGGNT
jgi:hypothetical protein